MRRKSGWIAPIDPPGHALQARMVSDPYVASPSAPNSVSFQPAGVVAK